MIRNRGNRNCVKRSKNESVEDPHELLLSLVDMGSLDCDECLLACVSEMSDAECKRVLSSLSLPNCCDEVEEEDIEVEDDEDVDFEDSDDMDEEVEEDISDDDASEDEIESDEDEDVEVESRIRRLERNLRAESMNRNRRFSRRSR
jgi:hypothetical protein